MLIQLAAIPLVSIPLVSIPLVSIPLVSIPLVSIPLVSIPLVLAYADADRHAPARIQVSLSMRGENMEHGNADH